MKERREVQKARWEFKVPPFTHYVPNQALTLLALNHSLRLEGKWDVGRRGDGLPNRMTSFGRPTSLGGRRYYISISPTSPVVCRSWEERSNQAV